MSSEPSLWRRVSTLFASRTADAPSAAAPEGSRQASPPESTRPARPAASLETGPLAQRSKDRVPWWRRRQTRLAQTREMAARVYELAGALQQHFERQDQRATEISGSLERVGTILEQLAQAERAHGDYLKTIAERTDAAGRHAAALGETLARVPDALVTQADAVRAVARQLEVSQEADTQLMHSLQQFGRAVDTLGSSGTQQVEVLNRLNVAQRQQQEALTALVREQSRRFLVITIVAGLVVVAGLAGLGFAVASFVLNGR